MCIYGYVVMPEHMHLLVQRPGPPYAARLDAFSQAVILETASRTKLDSPSSSFWQKRYDDRNVCDQHKFTVKLRHLHRNPAKHRNPVRQELVEDPRRWNWSNFRHYAMREVGVVEIESQWTAIDREAKASAGSARVFLYPGQRP
jgi:REP element-mobilizing transposase RayT